MSKQLQETTLTTRSARASLKEGTYWRGLDQDIHLGYRRSKRGGRWLVRWYEGQGKYRQQVLGVADDVVAAGNLDFASASRAARELVVSARCEQQASSAQKGQTVREAVEAYIVMRDRRDCERAGRSLKSDAHYKLTAYVLSQEGLCDQLIEKLSEKDLRDWIKTLPEGLARTTTKRIINDFRAALNEAVDKNRSRLSHMGPVIQFGLKLDATPMAAKDGVRANQILTDDQVRSVLAAAKAMDEDLWRMLLVLAATGTRFSQAKRMRVQDVQFDRGRLLLPQSFKGKKHGIGYIAIQVGPDVLDALRPVVDGRGPEDILLEHWRHRQASVGVWERDRRGPWQAPSELVRNWNQICEECDLTGRVVYSLRHSSIVRGIRTGIPLRLVAALHDTSVGMIEKHYSRWIVDGLEELAARAIVPLA
jgi:integrase